MQTMTFDVDSALLSELGERLVGSVHVAILELIKNAYDADATEVTISAEKTQDGIVTTIKDNGTGMTFEQVKQYWMKIATTNKVKDNISAKFGRPKSGAKGIGRFSCRRLGDHLELQTTAMVSKSSYQTTALKIHWNDFVAGVSLSQVQVEYQTETTDSGSSGTVLRIIGDNSKILTDSSIAFIKRHCVTLVANRGGKRIGFEVDPGFNLSFNFFQQKGEGFRNLRDDLLNAGWGTVKAVVDEEGKAHIMLDAMGPTKRCFTSEAIFKHIVGAKLTIGVLVDDKAQIRDKSVLSLGAMRTLLDEWGGVFVRYDGVRVQPYGNPTDDWLNIDRDRGLRRRMSEQSDIVKLAKSLKHITPERYLLQLLSSRAYVGDVEITSRMPGFEIKASREGFLSSPAFDELRLFARKAVDYVTLYRDQYLQEQTDRMLEETQRRFDSAATAIPLHDAAFDGHRHPVLPDNERSKQAIEFIRRGADSLTNRISESRRKILVDGICRATDVLEARQQKADEELRRLRLVASTSVLLSLFSHDVKAYLFAMEDAALRLQNVCAGNGQLQETLSPIIATINDNDKSLFKLIDLTLTIAAPGRSDHAARLSVLPRIGRVIECFGKIINAYNIKINVQNEDSIVYIGPMKESELYSILVNIVSNAIKAVVAKDSNQDNKIEIEVDSNGKSCTITCRDNGIGVDLAQAERLFAQYVSDPDQKLYSSLSRHINKEHQFLLGTGSGLGLSIVKEIVDSRQGVVGFVPPNEGWNTELRIRI